MNGQGGLKPEHTNFDTPFYAVELLHY